MAWCSLLLFTSIFYTGVTMRMVQSRVKSFARQAEHQQYASTRLQLRTTTTMPQQRAPLSEISGNARKRPNLTSTQRLQIIAKYEAGCSVPELVSEFDRDGSTIRRTIKHCLTRGTTQEAKRSGRPPILSTRQKKMIKRKVRAEPKIEYKTLQEVAQVALPTFDAVHLSIKPSRSTLYRYLKRQGLINRRCKKRPKLNRSRALRRLKWCREYRHFNFRRRTIKFSDEC